MTANAAAVTPAGISRPWTSRRSSRRRRRASAWRRRAAGRSHPQTTWRMPSRWTCAFTECSDGSRAHPRMLMRTSTTVCGAPAGMTEEAKPRALADAGGHAHVDFMEAAESPAAAAAGRTTPATFPRGRRSSGMSRGSERRAGSWCLRKPRADVSTISADRSPSGPPPKNACAHAVEQIGHRREVDGDFVGEPLRLRRATRRPVEAAASRRTPRRRRGSFSTSYARAASRNARTPVVARDVGMIPARQAAGRRA